MGELKTLRLRLKYWRTRRAMNIRQLVRESKVSSATIVKIEKEQHYVPRSDVINRLAKALNITVEDLVVDDSETRAA
jgi:transcriptional regulator with XRE-family HTH domain